MRNVLTVLAAAGTGPEYVVKLNIYLVDGVDAQVGYEASRSVWAITAQPSRSFPPQDTLALARLWRSTQ
jgi:enamine deaminase RidA (YjgF/YER057c/UK114 family)